MTQIRAEGDTLYASRSATEAPIFRLSVLLESGEPVDWKAGNRGKSGNGKWMEYVQSKIDIPLGSVFHVLIRTRSVC